MLMTYPFFLLFLNAVFVNGKFCRDPNLTVAEDFFYQGLKNLGDTQNLLASNVTLVTIEQFPGLNTLGISIIRVDYAPYGVNSPHIHPRSIVIFIILEGTLLVGFVTSNPEHRFFSKVLNKGDVFAFPVGLLHFQYNIGHSNVVAITALSRQFLGVITIGNITFGANPPINPDILAKAF